MLKTTITSIGLDLSLTGSGVVVLNNGKIVKQQLIKSKPVGDKPIDELKRIRKIVEGIEVVINEHKPTIAVIENLAFMARNTTALTQLAGLSFFVRAVLFDHNIPFYLCAPTTLKRFATGKGNSEKDHIILEVYKQYGIDFVDNNVADAIFLAKIGSAIAGYEKVKKTHQIETIELLKNQH